MMNLDYITPAHIARRVGISPNRARAFLRDLEPRDGPRLRQRFEPSRLDELAALCESKRQRKCFNKHNSHLIDSGAK